MATASKRFARCLAMAGVLMLSACATGDMWEDDDVLCKHYHTCNRHCILYGHCTQ
jgi:hypothetical protein